MKTLSGTFEHQLDGKNRIRIPKKVRALFPEGEAVYFMKYQGGCIAVFPESALEERLAALKDIKSNQPEQLRAKRAIMQAIELAEEDGQGRAVLSAAMRKHAGIQKDVITIGMVDYLEIWSAERYNGTATESDEAIGMSVEEALLTVAV